MHVSLAIDRLMKKNVSFFVAATADVNITVKEVGKEKRPKESKRTQTIEKKITPN